MSCSLLWLGLSVFSRLASGADSPTELRRGTTALNVRAGPTTDAAVIGTIGSHEPFEVYGRFPTTEGCLVEGWGQVGGNGYTCLDNTTVTTDVAVALPRLTTADAPDPSMYAEYLKTGVYAPNPAAPLVPWIYGKRWRRWGGKVWSSADSWAAGEPPAGELDLHHTYSFVSEVETPLGRAFVRPNGSVVPASELFVFPVTSFQGRDLRESPAVTGTLAAWVVATSGARVLAAPNRKSAVLLTLPHHQSLLVAAEPAAGGYWLVPDAGGPDVPGYVAGSSIRRLNVGTRPEEVAIDGLWLDIVLDQQTLVLMVGDAPVYATLISSGVEGHETPEGLFQVTDKVATGDMNSLAGADDPYKVEDVPWVVHFKPRYALHGAFWHWSFGQPASHGCVNLSPRDAQWVFAQLHPHIPDGFSRIEANPGDPGTWIRIRAN